MITYREYFEKLSEGATVEQISNEIGIDRSTLRKAITRGGWVSEGSGNNRKWVYTGEEPEPLDEPLRVGRVRGKVSGENERKNETTKEQMNERTEEVKKETTNQRSKQRLNQRSKVGTDERKNETTLVIRKRASFDIDVNLLKELKMQAIVRDKNIYEMVEEAIKNYLKDK